MCAGGDVCVFADMYMNIKSFENVNLCLYMCMYKHTCIQTSIHIVSGGSWVLLGALGCSWVFLAAAGCS